MAERFICPHCCTPLANPFEAENAKLREFATKTYAILTSPRPYTPQQVAEWYYTLDWIDQTAVELGIEV